MVIRIENVPYRPMYSATWSPVGDNVWKCYGANSRSEGLMEADFELTD